MITIQKENQILIVFDYMIADININEKFEAIITDLFF